tara:strand:- start:157 stop:561 length:405 start_codon:yes stop_codon:yes gene_type:complete
MKKSINESDPRDWDRAYKTAVAGRSPSVVPEKTAYDIMEEEANGKEENIENRRIVGVDQDMVNNPSHYNEGNIECIEAIEAMLTQEEYIGYLRGNVMKYSWRMRYKGSPIEDLRKARWYSLRLMNYLMENQDAI